MKWPDLEHYRTALQDPPRAFQNQRLKTCKVDVNPRTGIPRGSAGRNAVVYKLTDATGSIAARVFRHEPHPGRERRIKLIRDHLKRNRIGGLVDFDYEPEGLGVFDADEQRRRAFPLLTMDWVEGETLGTWFRNAAQRGDSRALSRMADAWVELVSGLQAAGMAHGDLQHGNVLVKNERFVLVDYDGMFVPTMTAPEDLLAYEAGMPGYQHPERASQPLSAAIDHFSAWVILIALRAVAADPGIWQRYPGTDDREELLIGELDISLPDRSPLWDELTHFSKDAKVADWSKMLLDSLGGPFAKIPPFEIDVFDELRVLVSARDWRGVRALATGKFASRSFPADLAAEVNEADRRVTCLDAVQARLREGRIRDVAKAYRPELLDDWAEPAVLDAARKAVAAVTALDALAVAEQSDPTGRALLDAWDRSADVLKDVAEADEYRESAGRWRRRIEAAVRLAEVVTGDGPDREVADAWAALEALGGHPDAAPHQSAALRASHRINTLKALANLASTEDEVTDRSFLKIWGEAEVLLDGRPEAVAHRKRADAARGRLDGLARLSEKIALADHGQASEKEIVEAADALPPGYGASHAPRVSAARRRISANKSLAAALRDDPASDRSIAAAAEALRAIGSWPVNPGIAARCELAIRRTERLGALEAIPRDLPLDERDARWLSLWDGELFEGCHEAKTARVRHAEAAARVALIEALNRAVEAGDPLAVRLLCQEPRLDGHPALDRRRAELAPLIQAGSRIERLLAAIRDGRRDVFLAEAEAEFIASHRDAFVPHRDRIEAWFDERLAAGDILRAATPPFIELPGGSAVTARWSWSEPRLARICLVAADPSRFLDNPAEARAGTLRLDPETHRRSHSGATLTIPPGCRRLHVTVWPAVDLGWGSRTGPPLRLGVHNVVGKGPLGRSASSSRGRRRSLRSTFRDWILALLNS